MRMIPLRGEIKRNETIYVTLKQRLRIRWWNALDVGQPISLVSVVSGNVNIVRDILNK